jgi:5-methyltetrahydropteroyltriglutamate--homocysteine methyltransferase
MKRSTERILTTHTGSLPRPDSLVELMFAKEEGRAVDARQHAERERRSVREVVESQQAAGIDVVSDGEMS